MGKVSVNQTGKDGIGLPKKLEASSITLKAKEVQITREGTIRVTGLSSGATHVIQLLVIQLLVDQGNAPLPYNPPAVASPGPTAGFDYQINPAFDGIDDGVLNMEK